MLATFALLAVVLAPAATVRGVTSPGVTEGLVNVEHLVRDASSAVPVIGFGMTSTNPNDALDSITIAFGGGGFDAGDDNDLRRLDVDSGVSGVALYRDTGSVDDALDAGDTPVRMDDIFWIGTAVFIDLSGHAETLPSAVTGQYHWIVAIRTADVAGTIDNGDAIVTLVPANAIVATDLDGVGFVSQPSLAVVTSPLFVRLTRTVDMLGGVDRWIGPASATVNAMAVLGLSIVDGGGTPNRGVQDAIQSLDLFLEERGGAVSSVDLQPLDTDGATSGIAFYLDTGSVDDAWDAGDAPVTIASIAPVVFLPGDATFTVTFAPPGLDVPDFNTGTVDIFVVVRTADIRTFDAFRLRILAGDITVAGILAGQPNTVDAALRTPLPLGATEVPSSDVVGDATPPRLRDLRWAEGSPYLAALGLDLYFSDQMPVVQFGDVRGDARDDESGLFEARFSAEPSLASSPATMALFGAGVWRAWGGSYGFDSASTDASSPAAVTVADGVGNTISTTEIDSDFRYRFTTESILILARPGWIAPSTPPFWVDPSGKLWFSHLIPGTMTPLLEVDIVSLFGGGLASASASAEPSLAGGPRPATEAYPPGTDAVRFTVEYDVDAGSTAASSPARVTALDNLGMSASLDFPYGLDAEGPSIAFTAPAAPSAVGGTFTVRAVVEDSLTAVADVEAQVDPAGGFRRMFFDGTEYFLPISSALYPDGWHRIIVRAVDMVGNENVVGIDLLFRNGAADTVPPAAAFTAPSQDAFVSATVTVQVQASDVGGVSIVTVRIGAAPPVEALLDPATGLYEYVWDTTGVPDGTYQLEAVARDAAGNEGRAIPIDVTVDNAAPVGSVSAPIVGQQIRGVFVFRVFATDAIGVKRVTLSVFATTVDMAYSAATGYYEYVVDTRSVADGGYEATATVEDVSGLTTTTPKVSFRVQNGDVLLTFGDVMLLLLLLFLIVAFATILYLGRRGTLGRWLRGTGPGRESELPKPTPPGEEP